MKPEMSAASSWMMSGAVPPSNCVTSWSCTESHDPSLYSTWILGWAAFQSFTIFLTAAMVGFWKARLWNLRFTVPPLSLPPPPPELQPATSPAAATAAAATIVSRFLICAPLRGLDRFWPPGHLFDAGRPKPVAGALPLHGARQ